MVLGSEEIVLMLGLIGIEGKIIEEPDSFLKEFEKLRNMPSIGMILVAIKLPEELIDQLIDFKLNNRRPFVHYIPDIFAPNIENEDVVLKRILNIIERIIA